MRKALEIQGFSCLLFSGVEGSRTPDLCSAIKRGSHGFPLFSRIFSILSRHGTDGNRCKNKRKSVF